MPTFNDSKCVVYKHRDGASAVILDANDNSSNRFPIGTQINQLEGSGMSEPSGDGLRIWEGDIVEDEEGNRTFDGSYRVTILTEALAVQAGTAVFLD